MLPPATTTGTTRTPRYPPLLAAATGDTCAAERFRHEQGAYTLTLKETGGVPDFSVTVAPVDASGAVVAGETYEARYGRPEPELCTGDKLAQCLTGTMDLDVESCVCGSYQLDTELNGTAPSPQRPPRSCAGRLSVGSLTIARLVPQPSWRSYLLRGLPAPSNFDTAWGRRTTVCVARLVPPAGSNAQSKRRTLGTFPCCSWCGSLLA